MCIIAFNSVVCSLAYLLAIWKTAAADQLHAKHQLLSSGDTVRPLAD
jgi:hypothetical protein